MSCVETGNDYTEVSPMIRKFCIAFIRELIISQLVDEFLTNAFSIIEMFLH